MTVARVIIDISTSAVDKIFDYSIPSDMQINVGDRVKVPFGNIKTEGFVVEIAEIAESKFILKDITMRLDEKPLIIPEMIELTYFMKDAFYLRYVDCLRLFLPASLRGGRVKELKREFLRPDKNLDKAAVLAKIGTRAKAQRRLIEEIGDGGYLSVLNAEYGAGAVRSLIDKGYLIKSSESVLRTPFKYILTENKQTVTLTGDQQAALDTIENTDKRVVLLHGVTGSGKTEVYLSAIDNALKANKTAIMLVPEISLTPQMLRIFRSRYGDRVAMLHSGLSAGERYDEWMRLYKGEAKVALGARSAIFAPLRDIGIIIIDEEHDQSYISETNPRFNAIDVAVERGNYNNARIILGSATPSIESYNNAMTGKYDLVTMTKRISDNGLPAISVVDMGRELLDGNNGIFSRELQADIKKEAEKGNQIIIFLNRRGFASFQMCKQCGYVAKCTDCDVSLTLHTDDNMLKCHYCGKRYKALTHCPNCGSDKIRYGKVGTERVVDELSKTLPGVKILRLDNDTTSSKSAYQDILGAFYRKEAQILVGTQMIAKGHDFPDVTLVGVLDADMSLYYSNYLSNERTFQLITQVSGRAGRADKIGKVVIQTYSPNHFIFKLIKQNNYKAFFEKEVNTREISKFPPFTTIVRILVRGEDERTVIDGTKAIYCDVKKIYNDNKQDFVYLQAMKSPVGKIEKLYRYQIIMRIIRRRDGIIIKDIHKAADNAQIGKVSVFIELNPSDMR